jgi:hypothetical protein
MILTIISAVLTALFTLPANAQSSRSIRTNSLTVLNAPAWLTERRVEKLTDSVEQLLEWQIRRVTVRFFNDAGAFASENKLKSSAVVAFTRKSDGTVSLSPQVKENEFDGVLTHELTHVVVNQKYRQAIPDWLEEGLANFISQKVAKRLGGRGRGVVDYAWLAQQSADSYTELGHPLGEGKDGTITRVRYRYAASTALMEMIASHCDVFDLMQLALGRRMEPYLKNTCELTDVDAALRAWVAAKSKTAAKKPN